MAFVDSKTDIANLALDLISSTKVNSIDTPETENERLISRWYDVVRIFLLENYAFNFATKRAVLPRLLTAPIFGDEIPYALPSDYVMFISAGAKHTQIKQHKVEGDVLYLNDGLTYEQDGSLPLRYTSDFETVSKFSGGFTMAFSNLLGAAICFQITNSRSSVDVLKKAALEHLKMAATQDAKESPVQIINRFTNYLQRQ
jgi:hypothetical protein